jgi:1-acyl-sn-glycerol-3-phosphate acyltransferase
MNFYERVYKRFAKLIKVLFRITVIGAENEPMTGGYIACSNHISNLDVLSTAVSVKRQIRFMAKKELFKIPLLKNLITALGAFPVDRTGNSVGSLRKSIALLEEGYVVGMFLQGHRYYGCSLESTRDKIKAGVAMTAYHAKVPVLPMYIHTKNARVRLFRPITVYVGKPIEYEELGFVKGGSAEYECAAMQIFDRIVELKQKAENKNA